MATFSLGKHPHVELCDLLKVDGAVETRKRCKIVAGQTVSFAGHSVQVVA